MSSRKDELHGSEQVPGGAEATSRELERELGPGNGAIARVARNLERVPGSEALKDTRIRALEQELKEVRPANDILK